MRGRFTQVGFSQRVDMDWLEYTANLVLAGSERAYINAALHDMLRDKLSIGHESGRGSREKTVSVLMKIWAAVPSELDHLRDRGLILLAKLPPKEHVVVHWGMSIAVYPFLGMVAESTGRLLRLQGEATTSQIQRRIREKYGERETVHRATRRVLRSFTNWDVLRDSPKAGTYIAGRIWNVTDPEVAAWLIEAVLRSNGRDRLPLRTVLESPVLFAFRLASISSATLTDSAQIEILSHALDDQFVYLVAR